MSEALTPAKPLNLGTENGWTEQPHYYLACREQNHPITTISPLNNASGLHTCVCSTCNITWSYDTSD